MAADQGAFVRSAPRRERGGETDTAEDSDEEEESEEEEEEESEVASSPSKSGLRQRKK